MIDRTYAFIKIFSKNRYVSILLLAVTVLTFIGVNVRGEKCGRNSVKILDYLVIWIQEICGICKLDRCGINYYSLKFY